MKEIEDMYNLGYDRGYTDGKEDGRFEGFFYGVTTSNVVILLAIGIIRLLLQ